MNALLSHARTFAEQPVYEGRDGSRMNSRRRIFSEDRNGLPNNRNSATAPKLILVPLTLSRGTQATLAIAKKLARESGAKLVLLHVVQLNIAGEERGIQRTRLLDELCRSAESQLQLLAQGLGGHATTEVLVCPGRPAEAIVDAAKRLQPDTVVLFKHGYRNWLRWLHRNTARAVMRQAPCRVCLIFQGKHDTTVNLMVAHHAN